MADPTLPEPLRREVFAAVVEAQDGGANVAESRVQVAEKFSLTETAVRTIEREGLDAGWPPL